MTRHRYSAKESLNRILRSISGVVIPYDEPDTISGDILSVDAVLSDIAELLEGSLPFSSGTVPKLFSESNYMYKKKCGVYAYLVTGTLTTCAVANDWYPILGSFVNDPFEDFTIQADQITYSGDITQYFEIDWHCTISGNSNSMRVFITVKHNDTVYDNQKMGTLMKTAEEYYSFSGTLVVPLEAGDTIQLVLQSDGNGDVVTVHYFNTTIAQFFF